MTFYTYDESVAMNACDSMGSVTNKLLNELKTMNSSVDATLADWTEDAKFAYEEAKAAWNALADNMPVCLKSATVALETISSHYSQMNQTGVKLWQQ